MANLFYYSQKNVLYLISFIQDGQQRNLRNPYQKELTVFSYLKAVSVGGVIMNSYIQESPMNQHRNESSMVQFAYPEDNRNDVNESSFPIISGSFSHAFPMLFPFECRLKNGPTKSPAASPCSAAHCAGRPGATP